MENQAIKKDLNTMDNENYNQQIIYSQKLEPNQIFMKINDNIDKICNRISRNLKENKLQVMSLIGRSLQIQQCEKVSEQLSKELYGLVASKNKIKIDYKILFTPLNKDLKPKEENKQEDGIQIDFSLGQNLNQSTRNTLQKYTKEEKIVSDLSNDQREIKVSAVSVPSRVIQQAAILLLEKKLDRVIIKSIGNAIPISLVVAEILRKRIPDLYQIIRIKAVEIKVTYHPKEQGLDVIEKKREVPSMDITLLFNPTENDKAQVGFQELLPKSEQVVKPLDEIIKGSNENRRRKYQDRRYEGPKNRTPLYRKKEEGQENYKKVLYKPKNVQQTQQSSQQQQPQQQQKQ